MGGTRRITEYGSKTRHGRNGRDGQKGRQEGENHQAWQEGETLDDVDLATANQKTAHFANGAAVGMAISKSGNGTIAPHIAPDGETIGELHKDMVGQHCFP